MDAGKILVGAGLNAASEYFKGNAESQRAEKEAARVDMNKRSESERLAVEKQRTEKLLDQRAKVQAGYAYKLQELKGEQAINKENLSHKNNIELEGVKNSGKSEKTGGYSEKELNTLEMKIRKDFNTSVEDANIMGVEAPLWSEFVNDKYPRQAELLGVSSETSSYGGGGTSSFVASIVNRVKGKGGASPEETMVASHSSNELPANTGYSSGGTANAAVVEPQPILVAEDDLVTTDTSNVAKDDVVAEAARKVEDSDKGVPPAAKAAVKKANLAISRGTPNTKLRDAVILAAKYIGKFSSNQWAKITEELETALEENKKEYEEKQK